MSGSATDSYVYDAFGNLVDSTGTTINNYLYTGEQHDPNVGFYYLRARYYNAIYGRFATTDNYPGSSHEPYSLHKYVYALSNPVKYTDPTGMYSFTELVTVMSIEAIAVSMASSVYMAEGYLYGILHGGRMPLKWTGTIEMYAGGYGPGFMGVAGGGAIVTLSSGCFCNSPNNGIEVRKVMYVLGFVVGIQMAIPVPENPLTGALGLMGNAFEGNITLFTPGVFGANPDIFYGFCSVLLGSFSTPAGGRQAGFIIMGMGGGDFSGDSIGLGIGVQMMGGFSLRLSEPVTGSCACSR